MTSKELEAACKRLDGGNVTKFCKRVGIDRRTYYRAMESGVVHPLTAYKVKEHDQ